MAEKGPVNMLPFAAFLYLAMVPSIQAMVFSEGFTIELPLWFQLRPFLRPPGLAQYKDTGGDLQFQDNEVPVHGQPPYPVHRDRTAQQDYNHPAYQDRTQHPAYPNFIQYPAPAPQHPQYPQQYPRAQAEQYPRTQPAQGPKVAPMQPVVHTAKETKTTTTTTGIPPEGDVEEYPEPDEEESEERR
ncbi:uncharacterized protein [Halyomorpha halys]|uniref:uncharacterized protein n=1 Tax=Halyomorpha halys TaxID=286706 RepID=UPI0006D4F72D|nr:activating signal cointegrator 1 complex subunit 2 homolog [Halyomorpha halys]